jgi:hypothetical protein
MFKIIFSTLVILSLALNIAIAQTTGQIDGVSQNKLNEYSNANAVDQARKQCKSVINTWGTSAVFNDDGQRAYIPPNYPRGNPGGGNVLSNDRGIFSQLNATNNILGDIFKTLVERNFGDDCFKALAMANSIEAVKKDLTAVQKKLVESDSQDPQAVKEKAKNKIIKDKAAGVQNDDHPQKESGLAAISSLINPKKKETNFKLTAAQIEDCANGKPVPGGYRACMREMINGNNPEDYAVETTFSVLAGVSNSNGDINDDAKYSGGLAASRYCVETKSGSNPEDVKWDDDNCKKYSKDPIVITQEKVKQLVNAPYNQAFSEAGTLGIDGGLSNISVRINKGKLFERNVNDNFGSEPNINVSLIDASSTKHALIGSATGTVTLGIEIHRAVINLYNSSTSSCKFVSVVDRAKVINETNTEKIILESYKVELENKWLAVLAAPRADHTNFFIKLSLDLSQKYSKDWLTKLLQDARTKVTACTSAASAAIPN